MDDVIYLRAPCRASYGKSNKDIIYNLAYPRLSSLEMAYVGVGILGIVLTYHKQSDLYQNHTQLLQLLCQVTWYYPHQGSFLEIEQQDLLFENFVSIFQLILLRSNLRDFDGLGSNSLGKAPFFGGCLRNGVV